MNSPQLAFVGATAITPFEEIPDSAIVLEGNRIVHVGPRRSLPPNPTARTIDLSGRFIAPGFIDIHIHGGAGSDFMDATRADFETVCRYHAAGGTTSLLATTAPAPLPEILAALRTVRAVQENPVLGAQVLGAHIEGPYLSMAKRGCHLKEFVRNPEKSEWEQLLEFEKEIKHITLAPEIPGALELMREWSRRGISISGGHTDSTYSEMMKAVDAGMAHATHMYCAMSTVARPHPPHRDAGRHLHGWSQAWAEHRGQEWGSSHAGAQQVHEQRGDDGRDGAEYFEFGAALPSGSGGDGDDQPNAISETR